MGTTTRPELIFLEGPQKGRRAVLMESVVVAGRSNQAGVRLTENSISREQLQFSFTEQGWIVENLSSGTPLLVNDKRFRRRKQILLGTGDVLGVGIETKMLFVDSGDDPSEALSDWRQAQPAAPAPAPSPEPKAELPAPAPPPEVDDLLMLEPQKPPPPPKAAIIGDDGVPQDPEADARQAKLKKYALIGGVYLLVMIVGFSLLSLSGGGGGKTAPTGEPKKLTDPQIREALESDLKKSPNPEASALALREARELFPRRFSQEHNLYLCAKKYRLYLAYRRPGDRFFERLEDETNFQAVKEDLIKKVQQLYSDAYFFARGKENDQAKDIFDRLLLNVLPINQTQDDPEVREVLIDHFKIYLNYVSQNLKKRRRR